MTRALPFANKGFSVLTWFGLLMPEEKSGAIRLTRLFADFEEKRTFGHEG